MNKIGIALAAAGAVTVATVLAGVFTGPRPAVSQQEGLQSLELTPYRSEALPLNNDRLVLRQEDGTRLEIPVTLEKRLDRASLSYTLRGQTKQKQGTYKLGWVLSSTDPRHPYEWYVTGFHSDGVAGPALFNDAAGHNYLGWVTGRSVVFEEVSKGKSPREAIQEHIMGVRPPGRCWVHVMDSLDEGPSWAGYNALHSEFSIDSISRDADGKYSLVVSGVNGGKAYTFVSSDGEDWRVQ